MHNDRNAALDAIDNLLGRLLAFVDFHHHALAVRAQRKEAMHARVQVKVDDRIGRFMIYRPIVFKRHRHRRKNSFDFSIARHKILLSDSMGSAIFLVPISQSIL